MDAPAAGNGASDAQAVHHAATGLVRIALRGLKMLSLTSYGPEQVNFLRYRPVLSNRRLKEEFGYVPRKTTREAFEFFLEHRRASR